MRRIVQGGVFATLAALGCVASALAGRAREERTETAAAVILDPSRPADRQMLQFGAARPQCALWSDWQKLCSRTGPNGSVRCTVDPNRSVEPSSPFCAASLGGWGEPDERSADEISSSERYCLVTTNAASWSPRTGTRRRRICIRHEPDRPFNGRRVAALDHPACRSWVDRTTRETVCTRTGNRAAGIPACAALAASRYEHPRLLVCGGWSPRMSCQSPHPTIPRPHPNAGVTINDPLAPDSGAVNGPFCEN